MYKQNFKLVLMVLFVPVMLMSIDYNLNNYQVPDYFSHGLSIRSYSDGQVTDKYDDQRSLHNGFIEAEYFVQKYSRKNILDINFNPHISYQLNYYNTTDSLRMDTDNPGLGLGFAFGGELRRYLIGDLFCDIEADFWTSTYHSESETKSLEYHSEGDGDSYTYSEAGKIGIGYGRIQDVSKACQSVEIFSELEKAGLLVRDVEIKDIENLADLLVELSTLRLFDSRLIKMEKVRQINRELTEKGLLAGDNIGSFVIIMDLYDLGSVFERKSGWELYPAFMLDNFDDNFESSSETVYTDTLASDYTADYETEKSSNSNQPGLHFNYFRVLSNQWQLDTGASYDYIYSDYHDERTRFVNHETEVDSLIENNDLEMEGYFVKLHLMLSWYPDTRTQIWSSLEYLISDMDIDESHYYYNSEYDYNNDSYSKKYSESQLDYMFSAGVNYYFSAKLRLNFTASYFVDDGKNNQHFDNIINNYQKYSSKFDYRLSVYYYLF